MITGHLYTKSRAAIAFVQGRRGEARILWRWMRNLPTSDDIRRARQHIGSRPEVMAEIHRLNADTQDEAERDE